MNDISLHYLPPQALEVEASIISSCLIHADSIDTCADILTHNDFYRTAHGIIFKTIAAMREKKQPVDLPSVASALKDADELENIGGAAFLSKLVDEIPMSASIRHHAGIVKDKAVLREIIAQANKTVQAAFEAQSATDLLDETQQAFLEISNPLAFQFTTAAELMDRAVDQIEKNSKGKYNSFPTGLVDLDNQMGGGFSGSKFIIICARPGIGKTAIALNIAGNIAASFRNRNIGEKVGFLELEMTDDELGIRSIAMKSGINTVYLFAGKEKTGDSWGQLSRDSWDGINQAASDISTYPILFDDTPALPLQEVVRRVRMLHKKGCRIVFIDQLSKIRHNIAKEYDRFTAIVNRLAELKKELRIPIVLLSQIGRNEMLKGTGALEEDADIIMRLRQTDEPLDPSGETFKASLTIEKHRGGPTGQIDLQWVPKITAFRNIADTIYG